MRTLKTSRFQKTVSLTVACAMLVGCSDIEHLLKDALQREVERQIQTAARDLEREATIWVDRSWRDIQKRVETELGTALSNAKVWLGLEAPADTGVLAAGTFTSLDTGVIKSSFVVAYRNAGGARVIGTPSSKVTRQNNLLIQYFKGGESVQSAIVMHESQGTAHSIPGQWLTAYESQGGTAKAGYPLTDPTDWTVDLITMIRWRDGNGRGARQLYQNNEGQYALMQIYGSETVMVVPHGVWAIYQNNSLRDTLGFPLSSYPLDDTAWKSTPGLDDTERQMLTTWESQPLRVLPFQRGSILFKSDLSAHEVIQIEQILGGATKLYAGLENEFARKHLDLVSLPGHLDSCALSTIQGAASIQREYFSGSINQLMVALIEAAFAPVGLGAGLTFKGLAKALFKNLVLQTIKDQTFTSETLAWSIAGVALDTFFAKAINDFASQPLTTLTMEGVKADYDQLATDRIVEKITIDKIAGPNQPDYVEITVIYDPRTHFAWGVIRSDCVSEGIAYQFRVDTYTGERDDKPTNVWDGRARYWDVGSGAEIR